MTTTTPNSSTAETRIAISTIQRPGNVRDLNAEHVTSLAQSIKLRGLLVPVIVRPVEGGHQLVAGHHRLAACESLGHTEIDVVIRDREGSSADTAAENVTRKDLNALEEARAVQAMLDEGYTNDGAAQALGWTKQRVSARAKILTLPEAGQQLVGSGAIPVSAIDNLLAILAVSPPLADAVIAAISTDAIDGAGLVRDPAWTIQRAVDVAPKGKWLAAYMGAFGEREVQGLRITGKKDLALLAEADKLHRQVEQYAYGPPTMRFSDAEIDQARAAGVLLEFTGGRTPLITDLDVYRQLVKQAIQRNVEELRERAAAKASNKRKSTSKTERTPRQDLDSEHRAAMRDLTALAHGVNLDLGAALLNDLAVVAPDDMDVARFFAYGLLGPATSSYLGTNDHVARTIASNGLRLILEEHRTTTTPTLKSGKPGKTKVTYHDTDDAMKWLWKFVNGAKTAGELYGRVLVVYAAQHYASQLVLPNSQRRGSVLPSSYNDTARKAFAKITKRVLPSTHKALEKALRDEAKSYDTKVNALDAKRAPAAAHDAGDQDDNDIDEDLDEDEN
jgi:ParB/RepB/Spo0J family partition protein